MSAWTPLLPIAMVGTERQAGPVPVWPGEIGALVAEAASGDESPSGQVLRAMAVVAACEAAGLQDRAWTATPPEPAPVDTRPVAPAGPGGHLRVLLRWALSDAPARLQQQVFIELGTAGFRLPEMLLPLALELGRRSVALRAPLLPVLGERGLWLARQREDWRYAAGVGADAPDESAWTEGTLEQRRAFLIRERGVDAAAGRARLTAALPELPAKERADLAAQLAVGLGPEDEALLDRLRADRGREVREVALSLLLNLPDAAHPRRARERLAPLLRRERALIRQHWVIDAPRAAGANDAANGTNGTNGTNGAEDATVISTADWAADQLVAERPQAEKLGERAWWLYQLVRQVPLGFWTATTAMTPAELLAWAAKTDWNEALRRGWFDVLGATREVDWCEAFIDAAGGPSHQVAQALGWLPQARRERYWLRHLEQGSLPLSALIAAASGGETLGPALSQALTAQLLARARAGQLKDDYAVRAMLAEFGAVVHPDSLAAYGALADLRADGETASYVDMLQAVAQTATLRRALLALNAPSTDGGPAAAFHPDSRPRTP